MLAILTIGTLTAQVPDAIRFRLHDLNGSGYKDECVVRFLPGATVSFDGSYDAYEMFSPNPNVPIVFTRTQDQAHTPLAINSHPSLLATSNIELYTFTPTVGNYKLESELLGPFNSNVSITLIDQNTGHRLCLDADTSVQFSVTANDTTNSRYMIEFKYGTLVSVQENHAGELRAWIGDGSLQLADMPAGEIKQVTLTSLSGQQVVNGIIGSTTKGSLRLPSLANGIYLVSVKTSSGVETRKIKI